MLNLIKGTILILLSKIISLFPKRHNLWIFASHANFNDNSKYLYLYVVGNHKSINAVWISKNRCELELLRSQGYKSFHRYSFTGILCQIFASTSFYSSYISNFCWPLVIGSVKVNLWHGIGVKRIEFNIKSGGIAHIFDNSLKSRILFFQHYVRPDYMLSSTEFVSEKVFKNAFRLKSEQLLNFGYPRCEYLLNSKIFNNKVDNSVRDFKELVNSFNHSYLYVPTWRSSNKNFFTDVFTDLDVLNDACSENGDFFCVKLHVNTPGFDKIVSREYSNIFFLENGVDLYEYIEVFDCIITDYSSIYYDFIIQNDKKAILFPFDYDEYMSDEQSTVLPYLESVSGTFVYTFDELLKALSNFDKLEEVDRNVVKLFWGNDYKNSSYSVVEKFI